MANGQLDGNHHYITYQEGIYVGYRYYETRYEDIVMGTANVGDYDYATKLRIRLVMVSVTQSLNTQL